MTAQTKPDLPQFDEILNLIRHLPQCETFAPDSQYVFYYLSKWLEHYKEALDFSKGFQVNRAALYWTGSDRIDGFDGKAFVDNCQSPTSSLQQLTRMLDADLQIFELESERVTPLSADELAMAASYGMMAVEEGTQLFCACSFGRGVKARSEEALSFLRKQESQSTIARDPSFRWDDNTLESFMTNHCGLDHAALIGAAIAGIMKGIPVILEGAEGQLVKALIEKTCGFPCDTIICTGDLMYPQSFDQPGQAMIMTATMLKALSVV